MKSFSTALKQSFANRISTIAKCIKIVRLDGVTYTFTSLDKDLEIDFEVYKASYSFNPTAYTSALGLQIENMEFEGAVDSLNIDDFDILKQKFYGAEAWVFSVDYKNIERGKDQILYGTIGEIEVSDKLFKMEIRGMSKKYSNLYTDYYGKMCRARLGDSRCGVDIVNNYTTYGSVIDDANGKQVTAKYIQLVLTTTNDAEAKLYEIKLNDRNMKNICTLDTEYRSVGAIKISTLSADDLKCGSDPAQSLYNLLDDDINSYVCINKVSTNILNTIQINFDIVYGFYNIELIDDSSNRVTQITIKTSNDGITFTTQITIPTSSFRKQDNSISCNFANLLTPTNASNRYKFFSDEIAAATDFPNFFQYGNLTWLTGLNTGVQTEIINSQTDGFVELAIPTPYNIYPGDTFKATPGCNHLLIGRDGTVRTGDCFTRFNNVLNFRGEPYLPNEDVLLSGYIAQVVSRESDNTEDPIVLSPVRE